jgi:hypothetical protein
VVVASGGHFAAAIFDIAPHPTVRQQPKAEPPLFEVVAHKTMHRYVVRCARINTHAADECTAWEQRHDSAAYRLSV